MVLLNFKNRIRQKGCLIILMVSLVQVLNLSAQSTGEKGVRFVKDQKKEKIDIYINGSFFTSYIKYLISGFVDRHRHQKHTQQKDTKAKSCHNQFI